MPSTWLFAIGVVVMGIAVAGLIVSVGIEMDTAGKSQ